MNDMAVYIAMAVEGFTLWWVLYHTEHLFIKWPLYGHHNLRDIPNVHRHEYVNTSMRIHRIPIRICIRCYLVVCMVSVLMPPVWSTYSYFFEIITMTPQLARWRLKSSAWRFFQPCIQAQIKENIKAPRHWPLCGEFTGDRRIPRTKGQ